LATMFELFPNPMADVQTSLFLLSSKIVGIHR
jgi:hypothetical protein